MMGPESMILLFWMLSFKPAFSLFSFTLIKKLLNSSSLSIFRVASSAHLRLLVFFPVILIVMETRKKKKKRESDWNCLGFYFLSCFSLVKESIVEFLVVQWLGLWAFTAEGENSVPKGIKIPQAGSMAEKKKKCSVGRQAVQSWRGSAMTSSIVQISCLIDLPSLMSGFILKVTLIFQVVILDPVSTWNFRQEKGNSRKGNKAGSC